MTDAIDIDESYLKEKIKPRRLDSRKGDNGSVLIVGGNTVYHGAPVLASIAASRSGADLVYVGVPRSIVDPVRSASPCIIVLPMSDNSLTVGSGNRLIGMLPKRFDSAAIGMGMTIAKGEALINLVRKLRDNGTRIILDASALTPGILDEIIGTDTVIPPHLGEYNRIFGVELRNIEDDLVKSVIHNAAKFKLTIVLKGSLNIIADKDGKLAKIRRTTPAMTIGGSGDVLDGILATFFAKMDAFDASVLAVHFNGQAAYMAFVETGLHIIATDIINNLSRVMKKYDVIE